MSRLFAAALVIVVIGGCGSSQLTPGPTFPPNQVPTLAPKTPTASPSSVQTAGVPDTVSPPTEVQPTAAPAGGTGLILQPYASGFSPLTFVTNAGDGSGDLYVVAQVGQIYRLAPGESLPGSPWLDIVSRISSGGERGLLGLAFHPDFASNGRFFVDYTNTEGNSVISEFKRAADGTVDPNSERVLLEVDQPFSNHNGGMLAFGPDGYLYIGFGDGGSGGDPQGNGQNVSVLLGKILRIDVDSGDPYGIPQGNPFQPGNAQGARPEIWDWGVRNPWRFSFDTKSDALFIGEVGQGQTEEVDVEPAAMGGRNYGWNIMEGDHCYNASSCDQTGLTLPVATYSHDGGNCSVTGGYVYRGTRWPALDGQYFYADYCSGTIWSFNADAAIAGASVSPQVARQTSLGITTFGRDESGELYVGDNAGEIYSLTAP